MEAWVSALVEVRGYWSAATEDGRLSRATRARYDQILGAFHRFAEASDVASPEAVTTALCQRFIEAPLRGGRRPGTATTRLRLTVLRTAFDALVDTGAVSTNPTNGLRVSQRASSRVPAPLSPMDVARLIALMRVSAGTPPWPSMSALALLGASHGEIAAALVSDFDADAAQIRLSQGAAMRILPVPAHLCEVLSRRVTARRPQPLDSPQVPLALARDVQSYPVNSLAPTVSQNLQRALALAGVVGPRLGPKSLREYAANAVYARTCRVEAVAEQLGMTSFDSAARLIDRAWQQSWGEVTRAGTGDDG